MKKVTMVFLSNVCLMGATLADISSGFHVGSTLHYGATHATSTGQVKGVPVSGSTRDVGGNSANIGFHGGYGYVQNSIYLGIETGYSIDNSRVEDTLGKGGLYGSSLLTRDGYLATHIRGGYLFNPSTMLYVSLGGTYGKWKLKDSLNNGFTYNNPGTGNKSSFSFSPCLGIETEIDKKIMLRVEYSHEFGSSVKATSPKLGSNNNFTHMHNIRTHYGKIGISYKL